MLVVVGLVVIVVIVCLLIIINCLSLVAFVAVGGLGLFDVISVLYLLGFCGIIGFNFLQKLSQYQLLTVALVFVSVFAFVHRGLYVFSNLVSDGKYFAKLRGFRFMHRICAPRWTGSFLV